MPEQLQHDEDDHGQAKATAEEPGEKGPAGGGDDGLSGEKKDVERHGREGLEERLMFILFSQPCGSVAVCFPVPLPGQRETPAGI